MGVTPGVMAGVAPSMAQTLSSALEGKLGTMVALRRSDAVAFKLLPLLNVFCGCV